LLPLLLDERDEVGEAAHGVLFPGSHILDYRAPGYQLALAHEHREAASTFGGRLQEKAETKKRTG